MATGGGSSAQSAPPRDVHVRPGRVAPREAHDGGGRRCEEEQCGLFFRAPSFRRRRSGGTTCSAAVITPQHKVRRAEDQVVVVAQQAPHFTSGCKAKLADELGESEGSGLERGAFRERSRSRRHVDVDRVEANREAQALRGARSALERLEPRKTVRGAASLLEPGPRWRRARASARRSASGRSATSFSARRGDRGRRGVGKGAQPLVLSKKRAEDNAAEEAAKDDVVNVRDDRVGHVQANERLVERHARGARADAAEVGAAARRAPRERKGAARRYGAAPRRGEVGGVPRAPGNPCSALGRGEHDRALRVPDRDAPEGKRARELPVACIRESHRLERDTREQLIDAVADDAPRAREVDAHRGVEVDRDLGAHERNGRHRVSVRFCFRFWMVRCIVHRCRLSAVAVAVAVALAVALVVVIVARCERIVLVTVAVAPRRQTSRTRGGALLSAAVLVRRLPTLRRRALHLLVGERPRVAHGGALEAREADQRAAILSAEGARHRGGAHGPPGRRPPQRSAAAAVAFGGAADAVRARYDETRVAKNRARAAPKHRDTTPPKPVLHRGTRVLGDPERTGVQNAETKEWMSKQKKPANKTINKTNLGQRVCFGSRPHRAAWSRTG